MAKYYDDIIDSALGAEQMLDQAAISARVEFNCPRLKTVVEASADILRMVGRPLHAREIAQAIQATGTAKLTGRTPWKTVTSRLSSDIRNLQERSQFQRDGHARFALREWGTVEFFVNRRRINPIDESIKVVPLDDFRRLIRKSKPRPLFQANIDDLIALSISMRRADAEETADFVQLIPTFIVRRDNEVLTYRRTKRLPEARLHYSRCVSFGGHMQADDTPDLFARTYTDTRGPMFRELYEELSFSAPIVPHYLGLLHLTSSLFEQQHVGIVFDVTVKKNTKIVSLEATMHSNVQFTTIQDLVAEQEGLDSWSKLLVGILKG